MVDLGKVKTGLATQEQPKTIEQQENEIKLILGENEIGKSNKYTVTWKNQESRRLDTDRIKKEAPELYTEYTKLSQTRVMRIKQNKLN